jgi:hypothetical protein
VRYRQTRGDNDQQRDVEKWQKNDARIDGSSADPAADRHKGVHYARRALQVAGDDSIAVANVAQPLAYFGEDIGTMTALADRALTLNPSYARGWIFLLCATGLLSLCRE